MGLNIFMTFTGFHLDLPKIGDMQPASTIGNHARLLHFDGNLCDAGSSHTHHLREKFLRQRQINAPRPRIRRSQRHIRVCASCKALQAAVCRT